MFDERSGWNLSGQFFDVRPQDTYRDAIVAGLGNTILCGISACALATMLSITLMYLTPKTQSRWRFRFRLTDLIRGIPVPLLLFLIYNALLYMPTFGSNFLGLSVEVSNRGLSLSLSARSVVPDFHGINKLTRWTSSTEFLSLVLSLALFGAVSISEIIRGAMAAVDVGQIEAGRALGLSERQIFWKVIWPQAILAAIAPVTNLYIFILRMTTLGSSVGYIDLYAVSNLAIAQTGQLLPFLITLATVMSGICIFIARASRILEYLLHRRMRLGSPM